MTCFPDVTVTKRKKGDKYIVLACDGIWDCVNNAEVVDKINNFRDKQKTTRETVHKIVEELFEEIIAPNTDDGIGTDNMTCILAFFNEEL